MNSSNNLVRSVSNSRRLRRLLLVLALTMALLALTACLSRLGGGDDAATAESAAAEGVDAQTRQFGDIDVLPAGPAYLVCTESCGDFGQCGVTADLGTVVLLNSQGPAGKVHDRAIPAGNAIDIISHREEAVFPQSGAASYTARYYNVSIQDQGLAWVAGWCVSTLPD